MSINMFFKMKGDMEMARNTAVYRKETKQGFISYITLFVSLSFGEL